ncbi:MAG: hypothetical protein R6V85_18225 [Polyangia bacterium]
MQRALTGLITVALAACGGDPPSRSTPSEAFYRLGSCVDRADAGCLYRELDRDSRRSVREMHRSLVEMRRLAERSYPQERREEALGVWLEAAQAGDPAACFALLNERRGWLVRVARGFGAVVEVKYGKGGTAAVLTTRGAELEMARDGGEWGLATFEQNLREDREHLARRLEQVRRNAAAFDEQRAALEPPPGAKGE